MGELGRAFRRLLTLRLGRLKLIDPVPAYDLWAATYDETDNLLVALDEAVFSGLIAEVPIRGRTVLDVGCGTGRHWAKIQAQGPAALCGVDASKGMLDRLRDKFPHATAVQVDNHLLPAIRDQTHDVLVSTLALAHFPDPEGAIAEWSRVVRSGGDVVITDLHPQAVARGACTFQHQNRTLAIRLYARDLDSIVKTAAQNGLDLLRTEQIVIDQKVECFFKGKNALEMFARLQGTPIIYGLHLRKRT